MTKLSAISLLSALGLAGCLHQDGELPKGPFEVGGRAALVMKDYARGCEDVTLVAADAKVTGLLADPADKAEGGFVGEVAFRDIGSKLDEVKRYRRIGCDANGYFRFENIPDGEYFLVARITWLVRMAHRGGFVVRRLSISGPVTNLNVSAPG